MSKFSVAITGGIGSGKSTVSNLIKELGYVVFSADDVYKDLLLDGEFFSGVLNSVNVEFDGDKSSTLKKVASLVFSNKEALKALNDYTHPKIMQKLFELNSKQSGVVFNEVPLLFEGGYENLYDNVIVVYRDKQKRIESVIKRSNLTSNEVEERIKNQFNYENILKSKHTIIYNDGTVIDLAESVKAVVDGICKKK